MRRHVTEARSSAEMRQPRASAVAALLACAGLALGGTAPAARADQSDKIVFDLSLSGLPAGRLAINGDIRGDRYGASGLVEATGLVGMFAKLRYDATVSGSHDAGGFHPETFDETAQRKNKTSRQTISYRGGVPASVTHTPPRAPRASDVDPARQGGTIDPLTALYAVLRDVDRSEACKLSAYMYDGSKRSQVSLDTPQPTTDGGITCAGEYRRIDGFSAEEMAKQPVFRFTLTYAPIAGNQRLRVTRIVTDTILGKGTLTRQ